MYCINCGNSIERDRPVCLFCNSDQLLDFYENKDMQHEGKITGKPLRLVGKEEILDKLKVEFDAFDDTWKISYRKTHSVPYGACICTFNYDGIEENGRPKLKDWTLVFWGRDDIKLISIDIKVGERTYRLNSNDRGHIGIHNLLVNPLNILKAAEGEARRKLEEMLALPDSFYNILDVAKFKIRINSTSGSHTLNDIQINHLRKYCIEFLDDLNVDVRLAVTN